MDHGLTVETTALLISIVTADTDRSLLPAGFVTMATVGPGAGGTSFLIRSGNPRVRLSIKPESLRTVIPWRESVAVRKEGRIIAYGRLEQPLCHCTERTYISVTERCIFDCRPAGPVTRREFLSDLFPG